MGKTEEDEADPFKDVFPVVKNDAERHAEEVDEFVAGDDVMCTKTL